MSLFIRAPDLGFLKLLCSKAQFFIVDPARKIRGTNSKNPNSMNNKSIILRDTRFKATADGHGGNRRTLQIEEILSKVGFEVHDLQDYKIWQSFTQKTFRQKLIILITRIPNILKFIRYLPCIIFDFKSLISDFRYFILSTLKSDKLRKLNHNQYGTPEVVIWEDSLNYLTPHMVKNKGLKLIALPHNFDSVGLRNCNLSEMNDNLISLRNEIRHLAKADYVFCISREEQWFLRFCGIDSDYLPYYPPETIVRDLLEIRKNRLSKNNRKDNSTNKFLILGSCTNPPTKDGIVDLIKWLTYISKTIDFEVKIAGYGSENLINELELSSEFKIIGSLSNKELLDVMSETTAVLIHQRYGLGALTKIPEMLIAGIPVIANNIAARSYYDYNEIHIYNNIQELAQLMSQTFLVPEVPLPPLQDEKRFIDACMNN